MPAYLHVLNGDCTADGLRGSGVPGDLAVWADVLWSGPLPDTDDPEAWRRARAGHLTGSSVPEYEQASSLMRDWDAPLTRWREYREVVFWFEHDLFDQALLVRHLAGFSKQGAEPGQLSLICIDHFPGVEPFHGLGQLDGAQLLSLFPHRRPITAPQLELGRQAWEAFTAASPTRLQGLADPGSSELPFLAGAVRRYLEEYPALDTGLSRTERTILEALAQAPSSPASLFLTVQNREERIFMGDLSFLEILQGLAHPDASMIQLTVEPSAATLPPGTAAITPLGRQVLAGEVDRVALLGIDRWYGGVHLQGRVVAWRWDARRACVVASA